VKTYVSEANATMDSPSLARTSIMPQDSLVTGSRSKLVRRSVGNRPPQPTRVRNESRADLAHLLDEAEESARENEEEIQRLKVHNAELLKEWQNTSANLAETKATISHTLEDQHFVSAWLQLRYDIKNWAVQHFGGPMPASATRLFKILNPPQTLIELTRHWKAYVNSDEHRPLLAQALVWNLLQTHVFAARAGVGRPGKEANGAYWAFQDQFHIAHLNENLKPRKSPPYTSQAKAVAPIS